MLLEYFAQYALRHSQISQTDLIVSAKRRTSSFVTSLADKTASVGVTMISKSIVTVFDYSLASIRSWSVVFTTKGVLNYNQHVMVDRGGIRRVWGFKYILALYRRLHTVVFVS